MDELLMPQDEPKLSRAQLAKLSALADGTLDPARREEVEHWVSSSPALWDVYASERQAVQLLERLRTEDRAPEPLRARLARRRVRARASWSPSRVALAAAGGALAAVALITALALPGGAPGSPSVSQAAALSLRGPTGLPPAPDPRDPRNRLTETVQDVYFPNWSRSLGWRAVGQRSDRLGGRAAHTVYYSSYGASAAYTIVGGAPLPEPSAPSKRLNGYNVQTLRVDGRTVVTWRRDGHTCVISASGVSAAVLDQMAAWRESPVSS